MDKRKQIDYIDSFLRRVFEPGDVIELRGLAAAGSVSALFDDLFTAARFAAWLNGEGVNVYYALNPIKRSSRTAQSHAPLNMPKLRSFRSSRDEDIACRNLYLIDIDPVRPTGVASTHEELTAALDLGLVVRDYLISLGWPDPIEVVSGNGYHLLYKADRCLGDSVDWKMVLRLLARKFDTHEAKIDTSVWNASRVSRLPGCRNHKGEATMERPHRLAKVVAYPVPIEPLIIGQVRKLAFTSLEQSRKSDAKPTLVIDEEGVHQLIEEFPDVLYLEKVTPRGDATHFGLAECPFVERAHWGQRVGTGKSVIILNEAEGYLGFKCFSDECSDHGIGDLLRLLRQRTGRGPSMVIWEDDFDWPAAFARLSVEDADPEYVVDADEEDEEETLTAADLCAALGIERGVACA